MRNSYCKVLENMHHIRAKYYYGLNQIGIKEKQMCPFSVNDNGCFFHITAKIFLLSYSKLSIVFVVAVIADCYLLYITNQIIQNGKENINI